MGPGTARALCDCCEAFPMVLLIGGAALFICGGIGAPLAAAASHPRISPPTQQHMGGLEQRVRRLEKQLEQKDE